MLDLFRNQNVFYKCKLYETEEKQSTSVSLFGNVPQVGGWGDSESGQSFLRNTIMNLKYWFV